MSHWAKLTPMQRIALIDKMQLARKKAHRKRVLAGEDAAGIKAKWRKLTPAQKKMIKAQMAAAGLDNRVTGGSFFSSVGKFLKKAAPYVLEKVVVPVAKDVITKKLTGKGVLKPKVRKTRGQGLKLAGRGLGLAGGRVPNGDVSDVILL